MSDINIDKGHAFNGRSFDCAIHAHDGCNYDKCSCWCHNDSEVK